MSTMAALGWSALSLVALFGLSWVWQRRCGNAGVVDVVWSASLGLLALFYGAATSSDSINRVLVPLLAGAWSLRLALYLLFNRVIGRPEDSRYQRLREEWGDDFQRRLFGFYLLQALIALVLSTAYLAAIKGGPPAATGWTVAGICVWLFALGGESAADRQLARFRSHPENRRQTCREGLWRYSRHPNYFFEWLHWFSYVLLAADGPYWWAALSAPAIMLYLLLRVTGIPYTESQALKSRGAGYAEYVRRTSAFVPWFPRDSS